MLGFMASVESYAASARAALKPGGRLVVTSCNNTADELVALLAPRFVERERLTYPTFSFGGSTGAKVATVAFVAADDGGAS